VTRHERALERERRRLQAAPLAGELEAARVELETLERVDNIPDRAEDQLRESAARLGRESAELASRESELAESEAQRAEIVATLDPRADAANDGLERLDLILPLHRRRLGELSDAREARKEIEERLARARAAFAADADDQRLRTIGSGSKAAQLEESARAHERRAHDASASRARAAEALDAKEIDLAGLAARRDELRGGLPSGAASEPPSAATLRRDEDTLRRLRVAVGERHALETALDAARSRHADRDAALDALRASPPGLPSAALAVFTVLGLLGGLGAGAWRFSLGDLPGAIGGGAAALVALLAFVVWIVARRGAADERRRYDERITTLHIELRQASETVTRQAQALDLLVETITADGAEVGVTTAVDVAAIEACEETLRADQDARAAFDSRVRELADVEPRLASAANERDRRLRQLRECEVAVRKLDAERREWATSTGLIASEISDEDGIDATLLVGLAQRARAACDVLAALDACAARIDALARETAAWDRDASALLLAAGFPNAEAMGHAERITRFEDLRQRCRRDRLARESLRTIEETIARQRSRVAAGRAALASLESERSRLFSQAGAHDEASFLRNVATFRRRAELERTIESALERLAGILGDGDGDGDGDRRADPASLRSLAGELVQSGRQSLERRVADCERAFAAAAARRDDVEAAHDSAHEARRRLEESSELAGLELRRECLRAELRALADRWRELAVAGALLGDTLVDFEREQQPSVLREASAIFRTVTLGRYAQIVQGRREGDVLAVEADGTRKRPRDLSAGTAEQLYLALRLGLAADFAQRGIGLPLVLDDVFVNFDPERQEGMARAIGTLARGQQVIFLTCHPHVAELLAGAGGAESLVELSPQIDTLVT